MVKTSQLLQHFYKQRFLLFILFFYTFLDGFRRYAIVFYIITQQKNGTIIN